MAKMKSQHLQAGKKAAPSEKLLSFVKTKAGQTVYATVGRANAIIFTGTVNKPESQMTPIEKMERLNIGISKKELETLKTRTELDYDKLAKLLSVTRATLINKP